MAETCGTVAGLGSGGDPPRRRQRTSKPRITTLLRTVPFFLLPFGTLLFFLFATGKTPQYAAAVAVLTGPDLRQTTGLHVPVDSGVAAAFLR